MLVCSSAYEALLENVQFIHNPANSYVSSRAVEGITADDTKSISSQEMTRETYPSEIYIQSLSKANEEEEKFSDEDLEVTQAIEKVLVSKGEPSQTRSTDQYAVAQSVVVEKEKEEISVDVIKDKDESNPVILSKERIDFDEDEIEEEKLKLPKRKRKNLNRTVAELQQKVNLKASSNMVLIPQHWSFRGEYSQDKSGIGKLAWKLSDFIKRDGTVNIRRSSRENRSTRKRVRLKLRPQNNIYRDGKVSVETRHLGFKIVDPTWMKQGVARKLRESEIEFQKRFFKRRAKPKVTIQEDKASPRLYWDRGKRSSRDIIIIGETQRYVCAPVSKISIPRGKVVTPPLPPPKPQLDQLLLKKSMSSLRKGHKGQPNTIQCNSQISEDDVTDDNETEALKKTNLHSSSKSGAREHDRFVKTPSIESDSISVANSDMTEDSLNTPVLQKDSEDENREDISEDENGPIDRCLAQLADSVIQPPDDCSLNRYLSQLGNVLATREDCQLDQCLSKLASNMNGNRATKGFNLSQHLPLCTWEHVCVDRGSDRSTPTSDRSSTTSRGSRSSQENLRKKTLNKSKHHHHHHRSIECKHSGDNMQVSALLENGNHSTNGRVITNGNAVSEHILMEKVVQKGLLKSKHRIASTSEEDECGRASSLGSTRELETPIPETTSDPGSVDLERPRKKRPLFRRSKKGLNGTCRQHIQSNKLGKKENNALRKEFQTRNSSTPRSSSSDVTVIQLEGDSNEHVTNVDSSNTFVTLINVDSSDCSNSAEEK
ncbi:uncharacterized protein TNCV_3636831 [Trichonephila clavipes]|nr:uncharacterized protein TNCV_3636831 [Trichonephila clavipes]